MPIAIAPPVGAGSTIVSIWAEEGRAASTYEGTVFPVGEHDHPTGEVVGLTADLATRATLTGTETLTNKTLEGPLIRPVGSGLVGVTVQGLDAQTGNLHEWKNFAGVVGSKVDSSGVLYGSDGSILISTTAANAAYVERAGATAATVAASETTTSTAFADLATVGPAATVTVGATGRALVSVYGYMQSSLAGGGTLIGFAVSGASTQAAADGLSASIVHAAAGAGNGSRIGATFLVTGLAAGSTTFTLKYRVESGTGTFDSRRIVVVPF